MKRFLVVLGIAYAVLSLVLLAVLVVAVNANTTAVRDNAKISQQLQTDTNENICDQQAYQPGQVCQGPGGN